MLSSQVIFFTNQAKYLTNFGCSQGINLVCNLKGYSWWITCFCGFLIMIPVSMIREFKNFSYLSLGLISCGFVIIFYFWIGLFVGENEYDHVKDAKDYNNVFLNYLAYSNIFMFQGILKFMGSVTFTLEYVPLMFAMRNSMKEPAKFRNYMVAVVSILVTIATLLTWSLNMVKI